jgi:hypothetical protein
MKPVSQCWRGHLRKLQPGLFESIQFGLDFGQLRTDPRQFAMVLKPGQLLSETIPTGSDLGDRLFGGS